MLANGRKMSDFDRMLSSHPDPAKRADAIEARIKKEGKTYPAQKSLPFDTSAKKGIKIPPSKNPTLSFIGCWCGESHAPTFLTLAGLN
jgi:hypothetical protein